MFDRCTRCLKIIWPWQYHTYDGAGLLFCSEGHKEEWKKLLVAVTFQQWEIERLFGHLGEENASTPE